MASQGFQFKEFYIRHDKCAMKVGTDSIILGSWVSPQNTSFVLDIGTGCGILALMMAQKSAKPSFAQAFAGDTKVYALEPEEFAFKQAQDNFNHSPWHRALQVFPDTLQGYLEKCEQCSDTDADAKLPKQYELIIANPPYYASHQARFSDKNLQQMTNTRKMARQTDSLSFLELLNGASRLLSKTGHFYCVLPVEAESAFKEAVSASSLCIQKRLDVRTTHRKGIKRQCWCVGKQHQDVQESMLTIHNEDGSYSDTFKALCSDFYLNF